MFLLHDQGMLIAVIMLNQIMVVAIIVNLMSERVQRVVPFLMIVTVPQIVLLMPLQSQPQPQLLKNVHIRATLGVVQSQKREEEVPVGPVQVVNHVVV